MRSLKKTWQTHHRHLKLLVTDTFIGDRGILLRWMSLVSQLSRNSADGSTINILYNRPRSCDEFIRFNQRFNTNSSSLPVPQSDFLSCLDVDFAITVPSIAPHVVPVTR
jgi:hypothetical protein